MAGYRVCAPQPLEEFVTQVFRRLGADEDIAMEVARHLVKANLSGHDSHGVIRVPQYVAQVEEGELVPSARPIILREFGATALIDAQRGFGAYSTVWATDWGVEKARQHGVSAAAIRHSMHIGRVGEYTERAAEKGFISIVTVGAGGPGLGGMVPFHGLGHFLGANPWSIGVPARGRPPMIMDISSSTTAEGKVRVALAKRAQMPLGCILDRNGHPTTDPEDFYAGGSLVPLGGEVAGHKGYCMGMASLLLSALAMIDDPNPTYIGASTTQQVVDPRGRMAGVFVIVIDPAAFGDKEHYEAMIGVNMAAAKRVPPVSGVEEVLVPGELEAISRARREREGIALPEATWQDLARLAERFGLPMP